MLTSLAYIFLVGLSLAEIFKKLHLPRIVGMLLGGVLLGPYLLDLLDPSILGISEELRSMALIIILIKAGLALNLTDLKKIGRPAVLLSFLPAVFEIAGCVLFAPVLLGVNLAEAALLGAVLGAVSPAVVVPKMVELIEAKRGTKKAVPQLILAGASLDDVFVILLFSTFLGLVQGKSASVLDFAAVPFSIVLGVLLGAATGCALAAVFELLHQRGRSMRGSVKVIVVLATAFLLTAAEDWLKPVLPVSGLLAVMSMAIAVQARCRTEVSKTLSEKFGKLWLAAELLLFVLVGAAVDIRYTLHAGAAAVALILLALVFRSAGVLLSLIRSELNWKERIFCVIAYLPKATVQAAIGGTALSLGLPCGRLVLSVAVLSILLTAPLGALGMDLSAGRLLQDDSGGLETDRL